MAHLDLDTDALAAASSGLRAAAAALAGAGTAVGHDDARAAGDPVLAAAVADLFAAWAPTHRGLVSAVEHLATALAHAAETFEAAEGMSAEKLAALLAPSAAAAGPRRDQAV